jgi:hypothetical protein
MPHIKAGIVSQVPQIKAGTIFHEIFHTQTSMEFTTLIVIDDCQRWWHEHATVNL